MKLEKLFNKIILLVITGVLISILYILVDISNKIDEIDPKKPKISNNIEPRKVDVDISNNPVIGNINAPVELVVFSDFECPYCYDLYKQIEEIRAEYIETGKVKFIFLNHPLKSHQKALLLARISEYAYDTGDFYTIYKLLFEEHQNITNDNYTAYLANYISDTALLREYVEKPNSNIAEDKKRAKSIDVKGTPVFIINGMLYLGVKTNEKFKQILDYAISEVENNCN